MTTVRRIAILGLATIITLLLRKMMFDSNHDKAVPLHQDVILSDPGGPLLVSSVDCSLLQFGLLSFIWDTESIESTAGPAYLPNLYFVFS